MLNLTAVALETAPTNMQHVLAKALGGLGLQGPVARLQRCVDGFFRFPARLSELCYEGNSLVPCSYSMLFFGVGTAIQLPVSRVVATGT